MARVENECLKLTLEVENPLLKNSIELLAKEFVATRHHQQQVRAASILPF